MEHKSRLHYERILNAYEKSDRERSISRKIEIVADEIDNEWQEDAVDYRQ